MEFHHRTGKRQEGILRRRERSVEGSNGSLVRGAKKSTVKKDKQAAARRKIGNHMSHNWCAQEKGESSRSKNPA